MTLEKS